MKLSQLKTIVTLIVTMNVVWTSGCTSMQAVPMAGAATQGPAVKMGEEVSVTQVDGRKLKFKVTAVEPDALVGAEVRVRYADIAKLEVRRPDHAETTGAVVSVLAGVVVVAAGYALANVPPPMGP